MHPRLVPARLHRPTRGLARALAVLCLSLAALPATAAAEQRLESFPLPSNGNVDLQAVHLNQVDDLRATVLLPDGYDSEPGKAWPVLYLLHGVGDNTTSWAKPWVGDVRTRAKGFPGIIVMPESGRSYFTDAWRGGARVGMNWERYFFDEVMPAVNARYRILPGRENHAIAGLSMGGYGAVLYAAQLPSYFGTAATWSGLLDLQDPLAEYTLAPLSRVNYARIWGAFHSPYVLAHDPLQLFGNLQAVRLYVSSGDGTTVVDPKIPWTLNSTILGGPAEGAAWITQRRFAGRGLDAGLDITSAHHLGLHAWPYWRRELQRTISWGFFKASKNAYDPLHFSYLTMAPHGNAYGLGFTFAALPTDTLTIARDGQTVTLTGKGTLTISPGATEADASGNGTRPDCTTTVQLPATITLPAGC